MMRVHMKADSAADIAAFQQHCAEELRQTRRLLPSSFAATRR